MSLSAAFNIISSSFAANAAQSAIVSSNIANVNTPGYSREIANLVTNSYGGADVASVTREANAALAEQVSTSTAQAAAQQAIADGLSTLAQTVSDSSSASSTSGANQNGASPSAMLANLQSALATYEASPSSSSAADAAVTAAKTLTASLNSGSAAVETVREQADQDMASSVSTINSLLSQFTAANNAVVSGLQAGTSVASAAGSARLDPDAAFAADRRLDDHRRQRLDVDLHRQRRDPLPGYGAYGRFHADADPGRWASGSPVTVDGVPVTGAEFADADPVGRARGLRGAARHARAPVSGPARSDRRRPHQRLRRERSVRFADAPVAAGPLHDARRNQPALESATTGLAAAIEVNPNVDPAAGGDATLLRDGGISDAGNPAYTYNSTGAASYTGRIQQLVGAIGATQSFDPSAGLGASASLSRLRERLGQLAAMARTARRATPRPIRTRSQPRRLRRCRTRPASISTPK